jgi:phospho-N-acetylmuramoyl-pentapeptide-transferase
LTWYSPAGLQAFWIAFGASALLAWPTLILLRRVGSASRISPFAPESHLKKEGTPNMGGLFVLAGWAIAIAVSEPSSQSAPIFILLAGFAFIGFVDDFVMPRFTSKRGLGWIPKLALQVATVTLYALWHDFSTASLWASFFVLFFANAINFADGLDLLASTLVILAIVPFVLILIGIEMLVGMALVGALLPFAVLNSPPAKLFMGDVGALAIGAVFGHVFASSPWQTAAWPWIVSVILILELIMVPMQIAAVKTIKRRIFPATPIHHGFEKLGWPESKVLWTFIIAQAALSMAAITVYAL